MEAAVEAEEDEGADLAVGLDVGGEPDFVVDVGVEDVEAGVALDVGEEAAAEFEVVEEVALGANEDLIVFVDPDGADEVADDGLEGVAGLGVGVAGVVDDDGGAAVEVDAAGVGEGAEFEDAGGGDDGVAVGVGGFAFGLEFGAALFGFGDLFVDLVALLLGFFGGEGFAVAGDDPVDLDAVDDEALGVYGGGLFELAVFVEALLLKVIVVGVVVVRGFGCLFVALDVVQELGDGREGRVSGRWLRGGLLC